MAYAYIALSASTANANGATATTTAVNMTGADLIVVTAGWDKRQTAPTFSDSLSNTWTQGTVITDTADFQAGSLYWSHVSSVGVAQTFSLTGGASVVSLAVAGFSGSTATPLDNQSTGADNVGVTTVQPGSITPTLTTYLVVTGVYSYGSNWTVTGPSINSSYVIPTGGYQAANANISAIAYRLTNSGATNPTWTTGNSGARGQVAEIASFKVGGGGATQGLFMQTPMNGLGVGGPFFANPLGYPVR